LIEIIINPSRAQLALSDIDMMIGDSSHGRREMKEISSRNA
jgi:hypothetical protein